MKDNYFLDTNILVYSFDTQNPDKMKLASQLIGDALEDQKGCISFQIIQEFSNVSTQKFTPPLNQNEIEKYVNRVLIPLCTVYASPDLYLEALDIKYRWKFSFYDSLVIAAALEANCKVLYSDDLQHQQKIRELTIVDPFR